MFVCICHLVTRKQIEALIASGVRSVDAIGERCRAGTECGKCRRNIQRILDASVPPAESPVLNTSLRE